MPAALTRFFPTTAPTRATASPQQPEDQLDLDIWDCPSTTRDTPLENLRFLPSLGVVVSFEHCSNEFNDCSPGAPPFIELDGRAAWSLGPMAGENGDKLTCQQVERPDNDAAGSSGYGEIDDGEVDDDAVGSSGYGEVDEAQI